MELILGLIVPKSSCAGPFSGPPPLVGRKIIDFCHLKSQVVLEYASSYAGIVGGGRPVKDNKIGGYRAF